jgi:hypothetical protein
MIYYSLGNFYFDTVGFENKSYDSYSVIFNFQKDGFKDFELIYYKKIDSKACLVKANKVDFSIDILNNYLDNDYLKK